MLNPARKAQFLGDLVYKIRNSILKGDVERINDLVESFNAVQLPKGYVYVDLKSKHMHYIAIGRSNVPLRSVLYIVDFFWLYEPVSRTWRVIKDRTGEYEALLDVEAAEQAVLQWKTL